MCFQHVESTLRQDLPQFLGRPSKGPHNRVIERLEGVPAEEAEDELPARPEDACELSNRHRNRVGFVVNRGEPREHAGEGPIGFVDGVDASNVEPDARVGRPGVIDERRYEGPYPRILDTGCDYAAGRSVAV